MNVKRALLLKRFVALACICYAPMTIGNETAVDLAEVYAREFADSSLFSQPKGMQRAASIYRQHFSANSLHDLDGLSNAELRLATLAAIDLAFYSGFYEYGSRREYTADAIERFNRVKSRGIEEPEDIKKIHYLLVSSRMLDEVTALVEEHPEAELPAPPEIELGLDFDPVKPGELALDPASGKFIARNVDLGRKYSIVIGAGCPISRRAAEHISESPELREVFRLANAIWLGSVGELDKDHVSNWNQALPDMPLTIAYNHEAWQDVDFASQPHFHFFVDGHLVARHSGWMGDNSVPEIWDALERMGLIENAQRPEEPAD